MSNIKGVSIEWVSDFPVFSKCAVCLEPATYVMFATVENEKYANKKVYGVPEIDEFCLMMRDKLGANFEMPLCDLHMEFGGSTN